MKIISLIIISQFFLACMMQPRKAEPRRQRGYSAISDLDNLEMLLINEQQPVHKSRSEADRLQSLRLGMEKNRVQRNLGSPMEVEVAGNPKYGNERWIYERNVPTLDGYYTERQVIYFEGGSVVGWESH